jgi:RNA polymerase sigma-70 factor (ECF subfamily)
MMRITEIEAEGAVARLRVEGDVTQQTVGDLQSASVAGLRKRGALALDVSGVRFVDPAGVSALQALVSQGAVLIGCSGFLSELLRTNGAAAAGAQGSDEVGGQSALLDDLRQGDEVAYEDLVRRYGGRMLATARRLLPNEDDAREVVQEAFLSAFRAIGGFSGNSKLSTWLHRIVVNAALMKIRSRRNRREESIDDLLPQFDEQGEWVSGMPVHDAPSDVLERRQTREMVRTCIDRLPQQYRTVLMLRDIEELDTEEVAGLLHVTPNAVKIRLHRARQALRTLLEEATGAAAAPRPAPMAPRLQQPW